MLPVPSLSRHPPAQCPPAHCYLSGNVHGWDVGGGLIGAAALLSCRSSGAFGKPMCLRHDATDFWRQGRLLSAEQLAPLSFGWGVHCQDAYLASVSAKCCAGAAFATSGGGQLAHR